MVGRLTDGVLHVQFGGGAIQARGEAAELAQRHAEVTCADLVVGAQLAPAALAGGLHGALPPALTPDADAAGVVAGVPEWRRATGADVLGAAVMLLLLGLQLLLQLLKQLIEVHLLAHGIQPRALVLRDMQEARVLVQPFPHAVIHGVVRRLDAAEVAGEGDVEAVVVRFVLHQNRPRHQVEARQRAVVQVALQGVVQHKPLVQRDRHPLVAQRGEEAFEHRPA